MKKAVSMMLFAMLIFSTVLIAAPITKCEDGEDPVRPLLFVNGKWTSFTDSPGYNFGEFPCNTEWLNFTVMVEWFQPPKYDPPRWPLVTTNVVMKSNISGTVFSPSTFQLNNSGHQYEMVSVSVPIAGSVSVPTTYYAWIRPVADNNVADNPMYFYFTKTPCIQPTATVSITKTANVTMAHVGDVIEYYFNVTNTGKVKLTDVYIDDNLTGRIDIGDLGPGEGTVVKATHTVSGSDPDPLVNNATVYAKYDSTVVYASDTWTVDILHPAIDVIKSANATMIHEGDWVEYNVTVVNVGDCNLSVVLSDPLLGISWSGTLTPGGKHEFIVDYQPTVDPTENTASASGTDALGLTVTDTASWTVDILHPAIDVIKSANATKAYAGDIIEYTIVVKNTGDCPLYNANVTDTFLGDIWTGTLDVGENETFTLTYTVKVGDPDPLVNTATASGKDVLGKMVTDEDTATVDLVAKICGYKFYDANLNGMLDNGEMGLGGWTIQLFKWNGTAWDWVANATTGSDGSYCFDGLDAGEYMVKEVAQQYWICTTVSSITVDLESGEISENNNFGNVCLKQGTGGKTLGYWANAGNKLITSEDVAALNALNLYTPSGWSHPLFSSDITKARSQISSYLLSANAKDMCWMLSAQLIATELNVRHGYLSNSTIVYVGPSTYVPSGFISIKKIMENANSALSGADRAEQEYWKNLLDGLNNNKLPFVCSEPCYPLYP